MQPNRAAACVSFVTIHAFDRRTDTFLATRPPCIQCSMVIIIIIRP